MRKSRRRPYKFLSTKRPDTPARPAFFPSNGCILGIVALFTGVASLALVGPDYIVLSSWRKDTNSANQSPPVFHSPKPPDKLIAKSWWTSAGRAGILSFALLPLCVVFALKSSPFAPFSWPFATQLHFDKLGVFHRWTARFIWLMTTLHVASWSVQLSRDCIGLGGESAYAYAWRYERFIYGWLAYVLLTSILALAAKALRKSHYEAFYAIHVLLVPLMLITCALHHPQIWWWALGTLGLWITERVWRLGRYLLLNGFYRRCVCWRKDWHLRLLSVDRVEPYTYPPAPFPFTRREMTILPCVPTPFCPPPGYAHAELLAGATIRLTYVSVTQIKWAPGQHFLINIPSVSKFTTHPFTTCSIFQQPSSEERLTVIVFLVRAKNGWTKDLWDTVAYHCIRGRTFIPTESPPPQTFLPSYGLLMKMNIEGPFGSSVRAAWGSYSTVVIVVGGSGVSFGMSVLEHLCRSISGRDLERSHRRLDNKFKTQRVRFVWLVREFGHIQWCASAIKRCMALLPGSELEVNVFVTKAQAAHGPSTRLPSEPLSLESTVPPPSPQFSRHSYGEALLTSPIESVDSIQPANSATYLNQGDDVGTHDLVNLTNYEGDHEFEIPGESSLNQHIRKEGKIRRAISRKLSNSGPVASTSKRMSLNVDHIGSDDSSSPQAYLSSDSQRLRSGVDFDVFVSDRRSQDFHQSDPFLSPSTSSNWVPPSQPCYPSSTADPNLHFPPQLLLPSDISDNRASVASQLSPQIPPPSDRSSIHTESHVGVRLGQEEARAVSVVAENVRPGKPKLDRILSYEVQEACGPVLVACCGPTSLNALVREVVSNQINPHGQDRDGRGYVALISEEFEY